MAHTGQSRIGLWIVAILAAVLLAGILLVGSCAAMFWSVAGGDAESGARRDAVREHFGALGVQLAQAASGGTDLLDAATRLRGVALPSDVVGLAIVQADSDDNRIVVLRNYSGRQTSRIVINGAGTVAFVDGKNERIFDLLETTATLGDGTDVEIELVLSPAPIAPGPE